MSNANSVNSEALAGDIIDFAVLGALAEKPRMPPRAHEVVLEICRPWLYPTGDVVRARFGRHLAASRVQLNGSGQLELTRSGQATVRAFLVNGVDTASHGLRVLSESLRLSLADQLEPDARVRMFEALLRARDECLAAQVGRLNTCRALGRSVDASAQLGVAIAQAHRAAISDLLERVSPKGSAPGIVA